MIFNMRFFIILCAIFFTSATRSQTKNETPESWYLSGQQELQKILNTQANTNRAKNIILFIGDGMGVSTVTASRIYDGQSKGLAGEENLLEFEKLPALALSKTYNTNQQTPDSAGTMTAIVTGIKSKAGFISVNQKAERGNCESASENFIPTFLEQVEEMGMSTGIVTTARLTHATPAATYAHVPERDWEGDNEMPIGLDPNLCKDIARQLIEFDKGDGIDVALGGGRQYFLPEANSGSSNSGNGRRKDGRNLPQEWLSNYSNAAYVENRQQLDNVDTKNTHHLLGLFSDSHMSYHADRKDVDAQQPSLEQMTRKALDILKKNPKGFFLMVEAGRIDHGHHAGNAYRALDDTQELSNAVKVARDMTSDKDTLIIVTADHSHTLTMAGYPTRGNPILGKVIGNDEKGNPENSPTLAGDEQPYTTLGYRNGRGFAVEHGGDRRYTSAANTGRHDLDEVDTEDQDFHQEALIPLTNESHAGEDVAIYAGGPWSHLFQQTHEQHYIYHVMRHAAQLDKAR